MVGGVGAGEGEPGKPGVSGVSDGWVGVVKVGPGWMGNPPRVVKVSPFGSSASPLTVKSPMWWVSWWNGHMQARLVSSW